MLHGNERHQSSLLLEEIDSKRETIGKKCRRYLHQMPPLVLIIGTVLLIAVAIAVIVCIANPEADTLKGGAFFDPIRTGVNSWPGGYNENDDSVEKNEEEMFAASLLPPNVTLCAGFGFACTSQPSVVISTSRRCDGHADCKDESDELNCTECKTRFWCEKPRAGPGRREKLCLRADQLCDGTKHCPHSHDESVYCRSKWEACPRETRRCVGSKLCIPEDAVCDGVQDCRNADDEEGCTSCNRGAKMCPMTGRCVPPSQLCDGLVHCEDGSDEMDCSCTSCSGSTVALCGNGRCLARDRVCDGIVDCEGGIDEQDCPGTCRALAANASSASAAAPPTVKTVVCADGRHHPEPEACSGLILACRDACPHACDAKQAFRCADGACIRKMDVCDGHSDCDGGEDEKGCDENCATSRTSFKCESSQKCIEMDARCDGVPDCDDFSDESNCTTCPSGSLHCVPDGRCLPALARCDGVADCSDGSDEANCSCEECTASHSNTYACESTPHCFRRDEVCTPLSRCPLPSKADKLYCEAKALEHH